MPFSVAIFLANGLAAILPSVLAGNVAFASGAGDGIAADFGVS